MEAVGEDVQLGLAPGDEAAVIPDEAVAIVEREVGRSHGFLLAPESLVRFGGGSAVPNLGACSGELISHKTPSLYRWLPNMSIWLT
jgi:hypothetical protein